MAKRRAEDSLLHDSPSKRCYRSLYSVDMQLESTLPPGGVSLGPPSLIALLGSRCRKRPHFFEDSDGDDERPGGGGGGVNKTSSKHVASALTVQTSGGFEERCRSRTSPNHKKRHREDGVGPDTVATKASEQAKADTNTEDCTYNTFQYWRTPLPELDLSLLEHAHDNSQAKDKGSSSSEDMET